MLQFDIFMENKFWDKLVAEIDEDGDGMIDVGEFLRYFGKGSKVDKDVLATITGLSVRTPENVLSLPPSSAPRHATPVPVLTASNCHHHRRSPRRRS